MSQMQWHLCLNFLATG